jgi:NAD+ synthase (glutamine-hydrolysing)
VPTKPGRLGRTVGTPVVVSRPLGFEDPAIRLTAVATIRVGLAQLNVTVGDLEGNAQLILDALREGAAEGCDLVAAPELALVGYPPEDLLLKDGFVADATVALEKLAAASPATLGIVGTVLPARHGLVDVRRPGDARDVPGAAARLPRRHLANAAVLVGAGRLHGAIAKRRLPNYAVFDEQRWFLPGEGPVATFGVARGSIGVVICEDVWIDEGPAVELARAGCGLVVVLNASPYFRGRPNERLEVLRRRGAETGCAIAYVNLVGGQDELVFDGASLVLGASGDVIARAPQFESALLVVDVDVPDAVGGNEVVDVSAHAGARSPRRVGTVAEPLDALEEIYRALVTGTRDYLAKNRFGTAVIALSGGIDSSLVATVAVDALGPDAVLGVAMPSRYSSSHSLDDAKELASRLGIRFVVAPIEAAHAALAHVLDPVLNGEPSGLTDENLQSRIRGVVLMGISNATGAIALTTGNKSELATGYTTLYGDSVGGFAVIKDVVKTLVYELCRYRNDRAAAEGSTPPIPTSVLDKPPSAELRPDQRDDDSLPPYDELDPVLEAYVEEDRTATELIADGFDAALVERVAALVDAAEYKRRQLPPGVRITSKSFGKDRRMPITNRYGTAPRS